MVCHDATRRVRFNMQGCPSSRSALQCRQAAGRDAPWAVVGVLSEKLPIRAASSGKPYSLWVLSDLNGAPMPLPLHAGINAVPALKQL